MKTRHNAVLLILPLVLLALNGCASSPVGEEPVRYAQSDVERVEAADIPTATLSQLASDNNAFAFDLYHAAAEGDANTMLSPVSVSLALAMTYAGAEGNTAAEMAEALHFTLPDDELHAAFNALDLLLSALDEGEDAAEDAQPFRLNIANAIWGQGGYPFEQPFLDTLSRHYGAGLRLLDFISQPEESRLEINRWVEDETEERIRDLVPEGAITPMTRLVLTNAIYFYGAWASQFEESATTDAPFTLLDGAIVTVPMMRQSEGFAYARGDGFTAIALPYQNNTTAMLVIMPDDGAFADFESALDADAYNEILASLTYGQVNLALPRWEFEASFGLVPAMQALGMNDAFTASADFTGITTTEQLLISDIIHKSFVSVDEQGTEAAAATAVIIKATSAMPEDPVEITIDKPFLFTIYEQSTGQVLFIGRVTNPAD